MRVTSALVSKVISKGRSAFIALLLTHRATNTAVGIASKVSTLAVQREAFDDAKHQPGMAGYAKYKLNGFVCAGIKALHDYKVSQGNKSPQLFAEPGGEFVFLEKATPANVKTAFDCTNKDMSLFPFAATAKVSGVANSTRLRGARASLSAIAVDVRLDPRHGHQAPQAGEAFDSRVCGPSPGR